ncbi:peptidoglycan-binding domain-containing protein [Streptomyces sp. NPDC051018]|uniref:peptidoglycan-binding domain-containing protein n=1 Tax=Streptomyces sp. NPDC051018 TaxID=3365639 RepID=UPI00378CF242
MKRKPVAIVSAMGVAAGLVMAAAGPAAASPACNIAGAIAAANGSIVGIPMSGSGTHCHLQQGYASPAVKVLQQSIRRCYGINIAADGQFGPLTRNAVATVQRREGIPADGVYGPQTRDHMAHALIAWEEQPPVGCARL